MCRRVIYILFAVIGLVQQVQAQARLRAWRDHYAMGSGQTLCVGNGKVYCGTSVGVFSYSLSSGEVDKLTKTNGLSDLSVTALAYIDALSVLVVGYANGNIDLVYPSRVVNLPDVRNRDGLGDKAIHHVLYHNGLIYLSTGFGVVVVNPSRDEVAETYFIGEGQERVDVRGLVICNGRFYAATSKGVRSALASDNMLVDSERWTTEPGPVDVLTVIASGSTLYALERSAITGANDKLWRCEGNVWSSTDCPAPEVKSLNLSYSRLLMADGKHLYICALDGQLLQTISGYDVSYTANNINPQMAMLIEPSRVVIADNQWGLGIGPTSNPTFVRPNGPATNTPFAMASNASQLAVVGGAYTDKFYPVYNDFNISLFQENRWKERYDYGRHDAVVVAFNPSNDNDCYVGTWCDGVIRMSGNNIDAAYTPDNSTLGFDGSNWSGDNCKVSGLCFDAQGNLWVSNPVTAKPISVRTPSGSWYSFTHTANLSIAERKQMVSTLHYHNGKLWLLIPRNGIFVLDPGSNIATQDDDKTLLLVPMLTDGSALGADVRSMAFDNEGQLWLGTSQGLVVCRNPDNVFSGIAFQRIKLPDVVEGLAVYLLEKEIVTSIKVDGGNRKWVGTQHAGVFLFSADASMELNHFTADNSPMPSNTVLSLEISPSTGEVFIGTDKGLVAYGGGATSGSKAYNSVYVYPNPVRPDYTGEVVIAGLIENTTVKITDVAGNLVYETTSIGGTALWDGRHFGGERVATGVYIIFLASPDGTQRASTKVLFVR